MTDAHTQQLAKKCLEQLEELVLLGKLQSSQLVDIRNHLDPIARPAPPIITARKPPAVPKISTLPQCKALWSYTGAEADELNFRENDRIELVEEVDSSWWRGCLINPDGSKSEALLFPSNYVEKISNTSTSITSPSLPARNLPPIYTPSSEQPSTYPDDKAMQGIHNNQVAMPAPYQERKKSSLGPPKWVPGVARWSSGGPPANPPPPPNGYISPTPSNQYPSPSMYPEKNGLSPVPSNNSYYQQNQNQFQNQNDMQVAAQGPSNPALYGTQQPVDDSHKRDKLKKFGGKMGQTLTTSFVGGVGFGLGSHLL